MDGSNNVIDFVKEKDRKEAIEWIKKMFAEADDTIRFNSEMTKIDQYDYTYTISKDDDNDDNGPKGAA